MTEAILNLGLPFVIVVIAMIVGSILEKKHFQSIKAREEKFFSIATLNTKEIPDDQPIHDARMVTGSVVVSIDYFKRFLASLRNIFGGEVKAYCSLLDRGRREAILRMKEDFPDADMIINFRVETSSISKGGKKSLGSTEVMAYGTAIKFANSES